MGNCVYLELEKGGEVKYIDERNRNGNVDLIGQAIRHNVLQNLLWGRNIVIRGLNLKEIDKEEEKKTVLNRIIITATWYAKNESPVSMIVEIN